MYKKHHRKEGYKQQAMEIISRLHLYLERGKEALFSAMRMANSIIAYEESHIGLSSEFELVDNGLYDTLIYDGEIIHLADTARVFHRCLTNLQGVFENDILFNFSAPQLSPKRIAHMADNLNSQDNGYWVGTESKQQLNQAATRYQAFLAGLRKDQLPNTSVAQQRWLNKVDHMMELLFFAIHVSSGQPARIPEWTTVKVRNSLFGSRNVFLAHGAIALITTYWKGQNIQCFKRSIARYLPKQLTQVLLKYLVLVCPVAISVANALHHDNNSEALASCVEACSSVLATIIATRRTRTRYLNNTCVTCFGRYREIERLKL